MKTSQIKKNRKEYIDNKTNMHYDIFKRKDIAKFTYYDYLNIEEQKKRHNNSVEESQEKYEVISCENTHNKHDKTYRDILSNKKYSTYIINEALKLDVAITEEELEKYSNRYITKEYLDKETDIVYKMKDKEIYFLIEHQSSVDYAMSFRLEEYKLEIIRSAVDKKKVKTKGYEIPTVIPIVIYTGKEKWTVGRKLNNVQDERLQKLNLQQYNLIDINKYKREELLKSNNFVDKVFLLEKMESGEEFTNIIPTIKKQITDEEDKNNLIKIIRVMLKEKIGQEKLEKLIKEMKGEDEDMLACVEMIREENKRIRAEGIKEGIKKGIEEGKKKRNIEIAKEMRKNKISIELIENITGLERATIENI